MRILVADDEGTTRLKLEGLLTKLGYEVLIARDGVEAWEILQRDDSPTLAIVDWIMPGMDGPSLLRKARGYLGDAPVMFISGYAEAEFSDLLEGEVGVSFLPKPIDIKTLAERVKQELRAA